MRSAPRRESLALLPLRWQPPSGGRRRGHRGRGRPRPPRPDAAPRSVPAPSGAPGPSVRAARSMSRGHLRVSARRPAGGGARRPPRSARPRCRAASRTAARSAAGRPTSGRDRDRLRQEREDAAAVVVDEHDGQADALSRAVTRAPRSCRNETSPTTSTTGPPATAAEPSAVETTPSMPFAPRLAGHAGRGSWTAASHPDRGPASNCRPTAGAVGQDVRQDRRRRALERLVERRSARRRIAASAAASAASQSISQGRRRLRGPARTPALRRDPSRSPRHPRGGTSPAGARPRASRHHHR